MNDNTVTNYSKTFFGMDISENVYRCLSPNGSPLMELKYITGVVNPETGVKVASSTSLHNHDFGLKSKDGKPLRFELLITGQYQDQDFETILPNIVRQMLSENILPGEGIVIQNADALSGYGSEMRHIVLVEFRGSKLGSVMHSDSQNIQWLRAIPVSTKELRYMSENGLPALIERLRKEREIADFARGSVV